MRLFVALCLHADLHAVLGQVIEDLRLLDRRDQVRWVDPVGIHLTLKFLGEAGDERVPDLEAGLGAAVRGRQAPRLALGLLGAFPDLRRPRVLWIGLAEEEWSPGSGGCLAPLQEAVEAATEALGWEREKRAFQPHLTLGRVREARGGGDLSLPPALLAALGRSAPALPPGPLLRVALMQSHLSPAGARYEERRAWELSLG